MSVNLEKTPANDELAAITHSRNFAEVCASADKFLETGEFQSGVIANLGGVENPEAILQAAGERLDLPYEQIVNLNCYITKGGQGYVSERHVTEDDLIHPGLIEALSPVIQKIDADFRERAGYDTETPLAPSVLIGVGVYDERTARGDAVPHLDNYGGKEAMYFYSLGPGTQIFPGDFYLDPNRPGDVEEKLLAEQIAEQQITPVEIPGDAIVAVGWDAVHASPSELHVGEQRVFMRVSYDSLSAENGKYLDQAPDTASQYVSGYDPDDY